MRGLVSFVVLSAFVWGAAHAAAPSGIASGDWVNTHFVDFSDDWPASGLSPQTDSWDQTSTTKIITSVQGVPKTGNTPGYVERKYITVGSGLNVSDSGVLSATGTTYTAGNNVQITSGVISTTDKDDGITAANGVTNRYATCSTSATTAVKDASITAGTFSLENGARVTVNFNMQNTADNPQLNVNNTGARPIYHKGAQITTGDNKKLLIGAVDFVYDTNHWNLIANYVDTDTQYGNAYYQTAADTNPSPTNNVSSYAGTAAKGRIVSNVEVDNATSKVKVTLDNVKVPVGSATAANNYAQIWIEN